MPYATILFIDDDIEDYLIMKDIFEDLRAGQILLYAPNGSAALSLLERQYNSKMHPIGLIVLDINMPVMNGPQVLKRIREDSRFSDIPVIMYSTYFSPADEKACCDLGVECCITKPATIEAIEAFSKSLLGFWNK